MAQSYSHIFILALEPFRNRLYRQACHLANSMPRTEDLLQHALRDAFRRAVQLGRPPELETLCRDALLAAARDRLSKVVTAADLDSADQQLVMPADTWARLAAAVQIEATKLSPSDGPAGQAIHPESLLYDPLLAPRRTVIAEELPDGFNLAPPVRFLIASVIALVTGLTFTTLMVNRKRPTPPPTPAQTQPYQIPTR